MKDSKATRFLKVNNNNNGLVVVVVVVAAHNRRLVLYSLHIYHINE